MRKIQRIFISANSSWCNEMDGWTFEESTRCGEMANVPMIIARNGESFIEVDKSQCVVYGTTEG